VVTSDIVIAADGVHSIGVEAILGKPSPLLTQETYNFCYRFLIPTENIAADPATRFWTEEGDGRIKMLVTNAKRLVCYPCRK
jgi:salicylate hydroxylase